MARAKPAKWADENGDGLEADEDCTSVDVAVKVEGEGPGLLKTLSGAGLQANLRGGWTAAEPHKWAGSEGERDTGGGGPPMS